MQRVAVIGNSGGGKSRPPATGLADYMNSANRVQMTEARVEHLATIDRQRRRARYRNAGASAVQTRPRLK